MPKTRAVLQQFFFDSKQLHSINKIEINTNRSKKNNLKLNNQTNFFHTWSIAKRIEYHNLWFHLATDHIFDFCRHKSTINDLRFVRTNHVSGSHLLCRKDSPQKCNFYKSVGIFCNGRGNNTEVRKRSKLCLCFQFSSTINIANSRGKTLERNN